MVDIAGATANLPPAEAIAAAKAGPLQPHQVLPTFMRPRMPAFMRRVQGPNGNVTLDDLSSPVSIEAEIALFHCLYPSYRRGSRVD